MKKHFVLGVVVGIPAVFTFLVLGLLCLFAAIYDKSVRWFGFFTAVASFGSATWIVFSFFKHLKTIVTEETKRPIVRVWTHNGDTVITTDKIYLLSLELKEEFLKAFCSDNPDKILVWPSPYVYHSNRRCSNGISQDELKAILDSCEVQETEMNMSVIGSSGNVGFRGMWRLIHGPNATPPVSK